MATLQQSDVKKALPGFDKKPVTITVPEFLSCLMFLFGFIWSLFHKEV
jgi:hypothetical protein